MPAGHFRRDSRLWIQFGYLEAIRTRLDQMDEIYLYIEPGMQRTTSRSASKVMRLSVDHTMGFDGCIVGREAM
jgi:hypothetical protein